MLFIKFCQSNIRNCGYILRQSKSIRMISSASIVYSQTSIDSGLVEEDCKPIEIDNPYEKKKQQCILCRMGICPDYKNVRLLSQFQSSYTGRIYGRHITGLCKQKQEHVEREIIKAQGAALMPSYHKHVDFLEDPHLFDPERPIRPHKY